MTHAGTTALLLLGLTTATAAEFNVRWQPLNEPGNLGRVESVSISPFDSKRLLAGGDVFGVGLSTDGGTSWEQALGITDCSEINDFTFHPGRSNVVWVGTLSGPYQSLDGGKTWKLERAGMPPMSSNTLTAPIQKVLFDPNNFECLLAIAGNHRHMGYGTVGTTCWGGVWKSSDGGEHWTKLTTIDDAGVGASEDGTGVLINDAGFAAGSSSIVFACSDQGGVYKSTDAGTNFMKVNAGLPNTKAWALALHPTDPKILWVSLGNGAGVWKSSDGGSTWNAANAGMSDLAPSSEFRTICVSHSNPDRLYCASWTRSASTYRSSNGGTTWSRIVTNASNHTLVGGTGNPSGLHFQWITVDPREPDHVLGACEGNVVQSFDAGATWKDITCYSAGSGWRGNGYSGLCCTAVGWNPFKAGQVFTLGMDGGKLLRTDDYFWSWKLADPGLIGPFNGSSAVTFAPDGTIYVGSGQFGNVSGAYRNEPIIRSTNWGVTWNYLARPLESTGDNKAVYVDPADPKKLWAIIGNLLYQSQNGGSNWAQLALNESGSLWNIAADPRHPGRLYVGARNGVFASTNGTDFSLMPGSPRSSQYEYVYVDPVAPDRLYAVSFNSGSWGGVYRYEGTWTRLLKKPRARALAIDPGNPRHLAVITKWWPARDLNRADGVWMSADAGDHWTQCNAGLRMLSGTTIAFNPDKSGQLILGTDGAGFYATDVGSSTAFNSTALVPGTIQAEDYDRGGEGIACHTSARSQSVSNYRSDTPYVKAGGSGYVLQLSTAGEWFKYSVNVVAAGNYDLNFRAASATGARVHLEANGVNVTGPVAIPRTDSGNRWVDIIVRNVRLDVGPQFRKLYVEAPSADLDYLSLAASRSP
jgi:hypothetical protein